MILIIDHHDSFINMICDYVATLDYQYELITTDDARLKNIDIKKYSHIIIGPGPGHPNDNALKTACNIIKLATDHQIPLLGICLGHQMIGSFFGAQIKTAEQICHGKIEKLCVINPSKLFQYLPNNFNVTRYHSLIIDHKMFPYSELEISATSQQNEIMAIKHKTLKIYGVQFHPESIMTEYGHKILENFLSD